MELPQGRKIDPTELADVFASQEGEIIQLIGGIGQGKTYRASMMALNLLEQGKVVYTNWHLDLPDEFDQRKSLKYVFMNTLFFRRRFYVINYKKNWHYYDMDRPDIVDYIASLTDCTVFCDEGQDLFDSYEGTKMSKQKRKSLTRTRHLNKTLVLVSQRAQAIAVTARANVNVFYKTQKKQGILTLFKPYFQILATEEIDAQNFPIWDDARVVDRYFISKRVLSIYNSWYLRNGIKRSQDVHFEAYDLTFLERLRLFVATAFRGTGLKPRATERREDDLLTNTLNRKLGIQESEHVV